MGLGPHLCFLHGFCEDSTLWDAIVDSLKNDYTILCIDLPGFGQSADEEVRSIPDTALLVNEILKSENAENCILFGHSMGGYIVAEYIKQFGTDISAAALIHSTCRSDSDDKKMHRVKTMEFLKNNGSKYFFPVFVKSLVAENNFTRLESKLNSLVQKTKTSSIIDGLESMRVRDDLLTALTHFNKPILFLIGQEDTHYKKKELFQQVALCSYAQVNVLENVGHLSMYEKPKNCLKSIRQFLNFVQLSMSEI